MKYKENNILSLQRLKQTLLIVSLILLLFDLALYFFTPGSSNVDKIPGFYVFFGMGSCFLIFVLSKLAGKKILKRKESYYD